MPEMKTLNGYEVVDAKARKEIEGLQEAVAAIPEYDLTPYATETYVDNAIDNIPEVDLSKHALKSELPTKVSQLQNDSKYITREEVPETDLSEYITESELNAKGYLTEHQSLDGKADKEHTHPSYALKSEIPDTSKFITSSDAQALVNTLASSVEEELAQCAKKTDIPTVPTKVSQLTNDSGYLTEHQDISGKADKNHTHAGYVEHSEYDTFEREIVHEVESIQANYAKKTDVPTKVSQLTNDSNYLTSIPSTYITEAELEAKNYLTEHQSLAAYATKTFVENTVAENQPNLTNYAKKSEIPDVSAFQTEAQVQALINEALGVIENGSY